MSHPASFFLAVLLTAQVAPAHPGSGIVVDGRGRVFFTDTGRGVWEIEPGGSTRLVSSSALHWMAAASSRDLDLPPPGNWFEHVRPHGSDLALVLCSDFPCAVAEDGSVIYADTRSPTRIVRRMASGREATIAGGSAGAGRAAAPVFRLITGIALAPDGAILVMDVDPGSNAHALRAVTARDGEVSTIASDFVPAAYQEIHDASGGANLCRGLARDASGLVYVAATGARAVLAVDHAKNNQVRTVLRSAAPWSPTAVATSGVDLYVLEYTDAPPGADGSDRTVWVPRVRKVRPDGRVETIAEIRR